MGRVAPLRSAADRARRGVTGSTLVRLRSTRLDDSSHSRPHHAPAREAALEVVRLLRSSGHVAYFAGGCVRDELLGRIPDDYDVATDATPDRISSLFRRTSQVGASFGVVLVKYGRGPGAGTVEVATFRSDGSYSDRRRPDSVHFSDPLADAQRRDFTINALFLDPVNDPAWPGHATLPGSPELSPAPLGGAIVDFVGGRRDLAGRLLKSVGDPDQRLAEDHLRALRAARLATKLELAIDPATAQAIRRHAAELSGVSRERIGDEVRLMLGMPRRAAAISWLQDLALDGAVLMEPPTPAVPSDTASTVVERLPASASYPLVLAAWAIDRGVAEPRSTDPAAAGPGVLHDPDPALWHGGPSRPVREVCSRWRRALCLSNDERDGLSSILSWAGLIGSRWSRLREAHRRRTVAMPWFEPSVTLLDAMAGAGRMDRTLVEHVRVQAEELRNSGAGVNPEPLVTGDDLTQAGCRPGPAYRRVLEALYDAQLESRIATREQGLELARSLGV